MDLDHERRMTEIEARSKSNTRRIEGIEKRQDDIEKLAISVEKLALRESNVESNVEKIKSKVDDLSNESGRKWDNMVDKIITVIAAAIVGFILAKFGL